jgi:hypothetical protein
MRSWRYHELCDLAILTLNAGIIVGGVASNDTHLASLVGSSLGVGCADNLVMHRHTGLPLLGLLPYKTTI